MNAHDEDLDLRQRFAVLRHAEQAGVTPFEGVLARPPAARRSVQGLVAPIAATLGVLAAAGVGIDRLLRPPTARSAEALSDWVAPTDFLLRAPGSELISGVPHLPTSPNERTMP